MSLSNGEKWYINNMVIKNGMKYLGKKDTEIFITSVMQKINNSSFIPPSSFIFNSGCFLSFDFVCQYILDNKITYKQLHDMIFENNGNFMINDIEGYPWVSFFSKLDKNQVKVILEIAKSENANVLFEVLEEINVLINNGETINSVIFLLNDDNYEKYFNGYSDSSLVDFGKKCHEIFGDEFIFGDYQKNEIYFSMNIKKQAKKTDIGSYINENIKSTRALLIALQAINLSPNMKKDNSDELCFSKIDVEFIDEWLDNNNYYSDEKIDELLTFIDVLKDNPQNYYLGNAFYNYYISKLEEDYSEQIEYIEKNGSDALNFEDALKYIKEKLSYYQYKELVYCLLNAKGLITKIIQDKKLKKEEYFKKLYSNIVEYVKDVGFFDVRDIMYKFNINDENMVLSIRNTLMDNKIIDISHKVIKPEKELTLEKNDDEDEEITIDDTIYNLEDVPNQLNERFNKYRGIKAFSNQIIIEFLIKEFLPKVDNSLKENPIFISKIQEVFTRIDINLIEFIVNLNLYGTFSDIISSKKYDDEIISKWIEYAKEYNIDLGNFDIEQIRYNTDEKTNDEDEEIIIATDDTIYDLDDVPNQLNKRFNKYKGTKVFSKKDILEFLINEFLPNVENSLKENPDIVSKIHEVFNGLDIKFIEFVVNLSLYGSFKGVISSKEYDIMIILELLKYSKEYDLDLKNFEPSDIDDYLLKIGYYEPDNLASLYEFFGYIMFNTSDYKYGDILKQYFIENSNVKENFEKLNNEIYDIEHIRYNNSVKKNDDDDDSRRNGGGTFSNGDESSNIKLESNDVPFVQKIETDKDMDEFVIEEKYVPKTKDKKNVVFESIICGISVISCAVMTSIDFKDILSSSVDCAKSLSTLISKIPTLQDIKLKLGDNNFVQYFIETSLYFKNLTQQKKPAMIM